MGEVTTIDPRLVVAPATGRFRPHPVEGALGVGAVVSPGQTVGFVEGFKLQTPIVSRFSGAVGGMLALWGQPLRLGQPVAWLEPLSEAPDLPPAEGSDTHLRLCAEEGTNPRDLALDHLELRGT